MKTLVNKKLSFKSKIGITIASVALAVALPQIIHVAGQFFGVKTALGELFLPMHLPVVMAAFSAGPVVGAVVGTLAPVISFALTGMPVATALPFILIEIFTYGLVAGLMKKSKANTFFKIALTQLSGRVMRLAAVFVAVSVFSLDGITVLGVGKSMLMGIAGVIIQWLVLPLFIKAFKDEQ